MTKEEIKQEIEDAFGRLQTSGDKLCEVKGQISLSFDFENENQYNEVVNLLQEEWGHFNHNFEVKEGLNVLVLPN